MVWLRPPLRLAETALSEVQDGCGCEGLEGRTGIKQHIS